MHDAYGFGAAASVVCYIPFLCNVIAWLNAGPADYATLYDGMMKKHKNLFILPGGVAEVTQNDVLLFSFKHSHTFRGANRFFTQNRAAMWCSLGAGKG